MHAQCTLFLSVKLNDDDDDDDDDDDLTETTVRRWTCCSIRTYAFILCIVEVNMSQRISLLSIHWLLLGTQGFKFRLSRNHVSDVNSFNIITISSMSLVGFPLFDL
jgi:hypothetical protein